jgi:hypothetical protein
MRRPRIGLPAIPLAAMGAMAVVYGLLGGDGHAPGDSLAWAQASSCGNAILEPGEECDPPGTTCPLSRSCNVDCACTVVTLDHFLCYEVKRIQFSDIPVTVEDRFGTRIEEVRYPKQLCNPTDKNEEGIGDPTDHLTAYALTVPRFEKRRDLMVSDQFGTHRLDALRPDFLMVPSGKDGVPQQPPLDHFQCYRVKGSRGTPRFLRRTVSVANQFESTTLTVVKPRRLCAPASKNGEDPTAPGHPDHLLCYKTRGTRFEGAAHTITDQFGTRSVLVIRRQELCVPALEGVATTSTTTTSTTASTAASTSTTPSTSTSSTTTTTTPYGSPGRAFLLPARSLLD